MIDCNDLIAQTLKPQTRDVLRCLADGESLTPLDALQRFGIGRLAARIDELRGLGYPVQTDLVTANGKRLPQGSLSGCDQGVRARDGDYRRAQGQAGQLAGCVREAVRRVTVKPQRSTGNVNTNSDFPTPMGRPRGSPVALKLTPEVSKAIATRVRLKITVNREHSVKALARDYNVPQTTIEAAIKRLRAKGYL